MGTKTEIKKTGAKHPFVMKPKLKLLKVDDHFAPSIEQLDIVYEIKGLTTDKVVLEITSVTHGGAALHTRELNVAEKTNGTHTLHWDGKVGAAGGDLKDHYIYPLYSPYKVHLYHDATYTDQKEFKVLYHSVDMRQGPWTPDEVEPAEADEKAWVQYKLNELGYYGGPVHNDTENYLSKAIIRYKANHKKLRELVYANYTNAITPILKSALKNGENPHKFLTGDAITNPAGKSTITLEALTYASNAEFDGDTKATDEPNRLNRPLIPLEAIIYLKRKDDSKALAPEAVGPVRVNWRVRDMDENLLLQQGHTALEPSYTRAYVEKCLKLHNGRVGANGDNCYKDFGGIREDIATNYATPFLLNDFYVPYHIEKDAAQKVVHGNAFVDKAKYPKRLGKAGIYFRPSAIGGDDYQLKAEIDFTGLPNKAALETMHGVKGETTRIHVQTGVFHIERFNKVAILVNWPARTGSNDWNQIRAEFKKAYVDIDTTAIATKTIKDVISEADYRAIVIANTAHHNPASITLHADALVGVALPAQGNMNAAAYKVALNTFTNGDYWDKINEDLREKISANVRKEYPNGFVVVNFLTHKPVDIMSAPPLNKHVTTANTRFVTWTFSKGMPDSVIFIDQKDPDKVYYVVAHEMGHNFWLRHWENVGGIPADHDTHDHNCLMSYSDPDANLSGHFPNQKPGKYTPHLCGKCDLKLRGWFIHAAGIPASTP